MIDGTAIPKYLYGILQWAFCITVLFYVPKRFKGWKLAGLASVVLMITVLLQLYFETTPISLWFLTIVIIYAVMVGFIFLIGRVTWNQSIYLSAQAFIYAQFAAAFIWQFYYFFGNNLHIHKLILLQYLIFGFVLMAFTYIIIRIYKHYHLKDYQFEINRGDIITVSSIAIIVFAISNLSFLGLSTPISSEYPEEIFYIRTLVNLCGVIFILVLQEYQIIAYAQRELTAVQNAFHLHYNQYILSKENICLANQRYHDIRHQINLIRAETDALKKDQYLRDVEATLNEYRIQANTGNGVIDTIITSKKITCDEANINFSYVVDGKLFDFMNTMDITSLFGNMIDNAIESVNLVINNEKKVINLNVYAQHELIIVNIENYYEHDLKYAQGKLITTKGQSFNHGYGIKSIRSVVDKYNGVLRINTKDNWFTLTLLFPFTKESSHSSEDKN